MLFNIDAHLLVCVVVRSAIAILRTLSLVQRSDVAGPSNNINMEM